MPNRWEQIPLRELCNFQNGFAFRNSDYVEESAGAYEVFRMGNILKGGGFNPNGDKAFVSREQGKRLSRFVLKEGDILMCMTDMKASMALLGHTARAPVSGRYLLNQRVGRITVRRPDNLDSRFLFYYSNSSEYISWLRARANSGVQVNLSTEAILNSPVLCPPISLQRRIASILLVYDDLIDVNRRRIALLDKMARRLFEEWFVNFRSPGHEGRAMVETPDGPLPAGWTMCPLSEIVTLTGDTISPSSTPDQNFDHYSFPAFDQSQLPLRERGQTILSNKLAFTGPCILIGKLNPRISRIWYVTAGSGLPQIASTEFVPLKPRASIPISLLYAYATSTKVAGALRSHSQGTSTSHQRVRPGDILRITLPLPNDEVVSLAGRNLAPIYELVERLRKANARLAASRDLLLPRLMSGELSVSAAERELEAVA